MALVAPVLWGPAADEAGLRAAARSWRSFATHLACTLADLSGTVRSVVASSEGASIDAFESYWAGLAGPDGAQLDELEQAARAMADALEQYADAVAQTRAEVLELAATIAATVALGAALTWATAGASAAAAAGTVAASTARAAGLAAVLASRASTIPRAVGVYATIRSLEAIAVYAVVEPARIATFHRGEDPFGSYAVDEALLAPVGSVVPIWQLATAVGRTPRPALAPLPRLAPPPPVDPPSSSSSSSSQGPRPGTSSRVTGSTGSGSTVRSAPGTQAGTDARGRPGRPAPGDIRRGAGRQGRRSTATPPDPDERGGRDAVPTGS